MKYDIFFCYNHYDCHTIYYTTECWNHKNWLCQPLLLWHGSGAGYWLIFWAGKIDSTNCYGSLPEQCNNIAMHYSLGLNMLNCMRENESAGSVSVSVSSKFLKRLPTVCSQICRYTRMTSGTVNNIMQKCCLHKHWHIIFVFGLVM